ncbi:Glycoside hydrolase, family 16 [Corchorus olitorius]|uniref:Xyloglucan endotransglucosylase/hydrolase n=1 Tax=Corchorus olitorius TaxID=93759 RepID=A0A1R3K428_9ROSI|nr:Glycoside hydrolase, family 16 [Corchorus olitorius]
MLAFNLAISLPIPEKPTFLSFKESFSTLFGDQNLRPLDANGNSVRISLTKSSASGFKSRSLYNSNFFSASIKLPPNNTAGVVVAFYTTNADVFKSNHDEIDFEFLGNVPGQEWIVQTNLFGNGNMQRGREERFKLGFDPTQDFHSYSILWNKNWIVFYVDDVPIRQVQRVDAMGGDFPSKPMSLYSTIWDGSDWATAGGKHKINYGFAPFNADFAKFVIPGNGCSTDQIQQCQDNANVQKFVADFNGLKGDELSKMEDFRKKHMTYSYCHDRRRYPSSLPECIHVKG